LNIYDFKVKAQNGSEVSLSDYKGKVLLIVNTAQDVALLLNMMNYRIFIMSSMTGGLKFLTFPAISLAIKLRVMMRRSILSAPVALVLPFLSSQRWM